MKDNQDAGKDTETLTQVFDEKKIPKNEKPGKTR